MGLAIVDEKKYKMYTAIRVFEYVALSCLCYNRLRQEFQLASMKKLTRLTSSVETCDILINELQVTSYELISLRAAFIARVTSYRLLLLCELRVTFCMQVTSYCLLYELRVTIIARVTSYSLLYELRVTVSCKSYELLFICKLQVLIDYARYDLLFNYQPQER